MNLETNTLYWVSIKGEDFHGTFIARYYSKLAELNYQPGFLGNGSFYKIDEVEVLRKVEKKLNL